MWHGNEVHEELWLEGYLALTDRAQCLRSQGMLPCDIDQKQLFSCCTRTEQGRLNISDGGTANPYNPSIQETTPVRLNIQL